MKANNCLKRFSLFLVNIYIHVVCDTKAFLQVYHSGILQSENKNKTVTINEVTDHPPLL